MRVTSGKDSTMTILETEQVSLAIACRNKLTTPFLIEAGDAQNEVLTTAELARLKFDPNHYRVNAYQGLAYDPMRKFNVRRQ